MPSRDLALADPRLAQLFGKLSARFQLFFPGWKLIATCTHRTTAEQLIEFKAGRSRLDGTAKVGPHNYQPSRAIDVMIVSPESVLLDTLIAWKKQPEILGRAMYGLVGSWVQEEGFRWGGDWDGDRSPVYTDPSESLNDPYHWELPKA